MDTPFSKTLEELQKTARVADKIDRERYELLQLLVKNKAWLIYVELLEAKMQLFSEALLLPAGSVDGAVALEWVKGAMSGLIMARDIPSVTIAAMEASVPVADGEE